jgi:hypothetical protein
MVLSDWWKAAQVLDVASTCHARSLVIKIYDFQIQIHRSPQFCA